MQHSLGSFDSVADHLSSNLKNYFKLNTEIYIIRICDVYTTYIYIYIYIQNYFKLQIYICIYSKQTPKYTIFTLFCTCTSGLHPSNPSFSSIPVSNSSTNIKRSGVVKRYFSKKT